VKILVAMSGGVDSSFAAALLKNEGHEVTGVTMKVWQDKANACPDGLMPDTAGPSASAKNSCCGAEAMLDARGVASLMDFPYYVLNYEDRFRENVIEFFVSEYLEGRTPNPCVACNDKVKFDPLLKTALGLKMDKLATGHYARLEKGSDGAYHLYKAKDLSKDQTYFLYRLGQAQLEKLLFPLGEMLKNEVRAQSQELGLATAMKAESMDICFVPQGDYGEIIRRMKPEAAAEGPVLDTQGRELGRHKGIAFYTVGQRKGLGIASEAPLYVVKLDRSKNAVVVGSEDDLLQSKARVGQVAWVSGRLPEAPVRASVKIRSSHPGAMATILPLENGACEIHFDEAQRAVTPGQAAVFYAADECLGGGVLESL
jgi:tRNA-specific 2-thiouridylase